MHSDRSASDHSSALLPEDLRDLPVLDASGFANCPVLLPDELRGALLLPSDSGDSYSTSRLESMAAKSHSTLDRGSSTGGDLKLMSVAASSVGASSASEARSDKHLSTTSGRGARGVGLAGACDMHSSMGTSGGSCKDWSFSDPDVHELLQQGAESINAKTTTSQYGLSSLDDLSLSLTAEEGNGDAKASAVTSTSTKS
mmetsp:Transcript_42188/g.94874  ORF Transcript_42188/g.94874 Transcript_42188/m.94874 type:complete len:199 (-) Transcript_42188:57-653(-)